MRASSQPLPIRLLTHNIRYATKSPFKGEEPWPIRAPRLLNELRYHTLYNQESFICLQEVLHEQLVYIGSNLNRPPRDYTHLLRSTESDWDYIGVGRDDGKTKGEYSPIFYRPAIWKCVEWTTIWLSETPDRPSKGWDAASIRILTIGTFQHRETKRRVLAMNTHLDDQGAESRKHAAEMIVQEINSRIGEDGIDAVFLAGDFNSEPDQEAYQILANPSSSPVVDLRDLVPESERYGHENTFTGFKRKDYTGLTRIDFLFLGSSGKLEEVWDLKGYAVLESRFEDGVWNSDHRAVVGDVVLKAEYGI